MEPGRGQWWLPGGAAGVLFLLFPLVVSNPYFIHLAVLFFLWVTLGVSWNLLGGYAGQVSFGHAAFFGVGAYTSSLLSVKGGIDPWVGLLGAGVAAGLVAIPMGLVCFRLRGPFFALAMLALSEFLRLVALNWRSLTDGAVGIMLPPIFAGKLPYYYIALGLAALALGLIAAVISSREGLILAAIREDPDAAEALGVDTARGKLLALLLSAFLTGAGGSFYANYMLYIDPSIVFSIPDLSIAVILVAVLGGMGTFFGPVVGAFAIVMLSELFRGLLAGANLIVYGVLIVVVILFVPEGIAGALGRARRLAPVFVRAE